jgi:hypothetical protein
MPAGSKYRERLPWLTRELQQSIKTKNKLYKRFKRNQTLFNRSAYNEHKRQLNREMRNAEKDHYHELLER